MRLYLIKFINLMLILCFVATLAHAWTHGSPSANIGSPIGVNLAQQQSVSSGQQMYMNILKSGGVWNGQPNNGSVCAGTTNEQDYIYSSGLVLDANIYPTTLTPTPSVVTGTITGPLLHVTAAPSQVWVGGTLTGSGVSASTTITSFNAQASASIPTGTPGVVTMNGSNLTAGTQVQIFANSGVLATPLVDGGLYFVIAAGLGANSFEISATMGGAAINFSGSPSGTPIVIAMATGSGGVGTYTVNNSQTVTSTSITETNTFTSLCTVLTKGMPSPFYPSGTYRLTWDGAGTIKVSSDAAATTCTSSPCTFTVTPSVNGIQLGITATTPGNYVKNVALILASNATAFDAGEQFDPTFIAKVKYFGTIRGMQATDTIGSPLVNWSARATPTQAFYNIGAGFVTDFPSTSDGSPKGMPYEVLIDLCNKINANCWINEPSISNATYVSNMAALFAGRLHSNLSVYVERSNEAWNTGAIAIANMNLFNTWAALGGALFPTAVNDAQRIEAYNTQRSIDDMAVWKTAFGSNSSHVIRVFGGFAGNNQYNIDFLGATTPYLGGGSWTGTVASHHDLLATAPYYDITPPSAWTGDIDGGLTRLFGLVSTGAGIPAGVGTATTGTSTAYVLADGTGTGCPAAVNTNGYATVVIFNQTNGANPTLAVDGCAAQPILYDGAAISGGPAGVAPAATALASGGANSYVAVYTTTTSAGAVTTSWRLLCGPGQGCAGQTISSALGLISVNKATATANGIGLALYEGGWGFVAAADPPDIWAVLYNTAAHDARSYNTTQLLMNGLRNTVGLNEVFVYYDGISIGGFRGQNWGLLDSTYQTTSSKYQGALDFIAANPCWWTTNGVSCRH